MNRAVIWRHILQAAGASVFVALSIGCARMETRMMETTGYCGCGRCCGWERGSWKYLKLDFWNRYVSVGPRKGRPYDGRTASGTKPRVPRHGLFSADSFTHPWRIVPRIVFFPWLLLPRDGSIAADTAYHSFGTRIHVPGYGWGCVEDRGSAIRGPQRLDLFFGSHGKALRWGRRTLGVDIQRE